MAGDYIGVPSAGLQFGQVITTGLAGPSNADDYEYQVFDEFGRPYPRGATIPAGARVSIGYPPQTPTGGDVVTGSQIKLDEANIAALAAQAKYQQDSLAAQTQQAQQQLALQQQQLSEQSRIADRQFEQTAQENQRRYELDRALLGEQQAMRLFNERMSTAQNQRDNVRLKIEQQQQLLQAQDSLAARKTDLMRLASELRGPGDWVAYDNLANGFAAPEARGEQTTNIFDAVKGLEDQIRGLQGQEGQTFNYGEGGAQSPAPALPGASPQAPQQGAPGGGGPALTPQISVPNVSGGGGGQALTPQITTPQPMPAAGFGGYQGEPGSTYGVPTTDGGFGGAVPSNISAMQQQGDFISRQQNLVAQAQALGGGSQGPIDYTDKTGIRKMQNGGQTSANMVITGDHSSGRENPELVVNPTNAPMAVIPIRQMAENALRRQGVPAAQDGGVWNAGEDIGSGIIRSRTYDPNTLGNMPFIRQLRGERTPAWSGFGASLDNRNLGIQDMPSQFSMRTWNNFRPSQQLMTQDLYERGLGVSFDDIYAKSQRAAPTGYTTPVAAYGR